MACLRSSRAAQERLLLLILNAVSSSERILLHAVAESALRPKALCSCVEGVSLRLFWPVTRQLRSECWPRSFAMGRSPNPPRTAPWTTVPSLNTRLLCMCRCVSHRPRAGVAFSWRFNKTSYRRRRQAPSHVVSRVQKSLGFNKHVGMHMLCYPSYN